MIMNELDKRNMFLKTFAHAQKLLHCVFKPDYHGNLSGKYLLPVFS